MGTHIYIRSFGRKGYLTGLGTIPRVMPFLATVIALHMCYTLLGNPFPRSGVLRSMLTFLGLFVMKEPFSLKLTSLGN